MFRPIIHAHCDMGNRNEPHSEIPQLSLRLCLWHTKKCARICINTRRRPPIIPQSTRPPHSDPTSQSSSLIHHVHRLQALRRRLSHEHLRAQCLVRSVEGHQYPHLRCYSPAQDADQRRRRFPCKWGYRDPSPGLFCYLVSSLTAN